MPCAGLPAVPPQPPPPPAAPAAPQVKLITPDVMPPPHEHAPVPPAPLTRTIVVSGVEPIYVPAVGTASENKFVTSLMPPPASFSVSAAPTNPVVRLSRRATSGNKQVVTLVSDLSLLEHLKPEPPLAPPQPQPPPPAAASSSPGTQTVYLKQVFSDGGGGDVVDVAAVHTAHAQRPLSVQPLPPPPPPPPPPQMQPPSRKERQSLMKKVTSISCFKCQMCGFLGLTNRAVEDHMLLEHDADLSDDGGDDSWLAVAQKEGIKLECPFCPNKFNAEGSRSFKVTVVQRWKDLI